jgi:single-strand DNA-binding protein
MSKGVNRVILIGNLGGSPELRSTAGGTPVCDLRLATSRRWNDAKGSPQEETEWHKIVVWDKLATTCHQFLQKGQRVYVEGRIQTRKWADRDGQPRYSTEIVAQDVVFLSARKDAEPEALADPTAAW